MEVTRSQEEPLMGLGVLKESHEFVDLRRRRRRRCLPQRGKMQVSPFPFGISFSFPGPKVSSSYQFSFLHFCFSSTLLIRFFLPPSFIHWLIPLGNSLFFTLASSSISSLSFTSVSLLPS